jgi:hypothetical protein
LVLRDLRYYNDRQQTRTKDSSIEIHWHIMVHRKLSPLISTEVNRGFYTGIQEGDGGEHDRCARYISDKTKLRGAHCAAYCLASARIRDESYEVVPHPSNKKHGRNHRASASCGAESIVRGSHKTLRLWQLAGEALSIEPR